ncbi:hypothetical protein KAT63_02925 [Candidatus Parcubacteria bacterium]|nr:hypothetical protein [Candidatus Parcubacteria bacterium]
MKSRNSDKQESFRWIKAGLTVIIFSLVISVVIVKAGFLISTVSPVVTSHIFSDTYAKPAVNPSIMNPSSQTNAHGRRIIKIGTQIWMAENLNAGTRIDGASEQTDNGIIEKYCYDNNEENCATDGGLYQWNEAMGHTTTEGAQGICPNGFHIPTDAELHILENYLKDGANSCNSTRSYGQDCDTAGTKLKVGGTSGFESILTGYRGISSSLFSGQGRYAHFWSSSQRDVYVFRVWLRYLYSPSTVGRASYPKTYGLSIRCLKDVSLPDAAAMKE